MKKFLSIVLIINLALCFTGCNKKAEIKDEEVKINLPKDNTVNGYRVNGNSSTLPNTITASQVVPENVQNTQVSTSYCANKNSKIFHSTNCSSIKNMKEENRVYISNREECVNNGYKPCKSCNP